MQSWLTKHRYIIAIFNGTWTDFIQTKAINVLSASFRGSISFFYQVPKTSTTTSVGLIKWVKNSFSKPLSIVKSEKLTFSSLSNEWFTEQTCSFWFQCFSSYIILKKKHVQLYLSLFADKEERSSDLAVLFCFPNFLMKGASFKQQQQK